MGSGVQLSVCLASLHDKITTRVWAGIDGRPKLQPPAWPRQLGESCSGGRGRLGLGSFDAAEAEPGRAASSPGPSAWEPRPLGQSRNHGPISPRLGSMATGGSASSERHAPEASISRTERGAASGACKLPFGRKERRSTVAEQA